MSNFLPNFLKKHKSLFILIGILTVAGYLRIVNAEKWFDFAHDGDLYSWIFKDIVINGHQRLIGQVTSTPGIFIGSLFYYAVIPFFFLTNLEPVGTVYFALILGLITTFSFYYVFKKIFNPTVGLIAASLHGFLLARLEYDRWIVPTITTSLWEIWYFYTILGIVRGNFNVLPILGILIGLIWHISFSLTPSLLAIPVAFLLSGKLPNFKNILLGGISLIITTSPFVYFEIRHNFSQVRSFIKSFQVDQGGGTGLEKFGHVLSQVSGNAYQLIFHPERGAVWQRELVFVLILLIGLYLAFKKFISYKVLVSLYTWLIGVVLFFSFSSKIISEYYFTSINMVVLAILILFLAYIHQKYKIGKILIPMLLIIIAVHSIYYMNFGYRYNFLGYQERKSAIEFISQNAITNNYPCIAISYIARPGYAFGFRYLIYLNDLKINKIGSGAPIYSIVIPSDYIKVDNLNKFGNIGVLVEGSKTSNDKLKEICQSENTNLTDPMFGYTE